MRNFIIVFAIFLVFFMGCNSNNSDDPVSVSSSQGGIMLKFDKTLAPSNVVLVVAQLTREGYSAFNGTMNIQSDTSAEISFPGIAAGVWHLKVEASDSANIVVYRGETDVTIVSGMVSQVQLTLQPTGNGTGSIQISVSWGTQIPAIWTDYPANPIFSKVNLSSAGTRNPVILQGSDNSWKMWYAHLYNAGAADTWLAVSSDGISWQSALSAPVLSRGNNWDSHFIMPGAVIMINNAYYMYYTAGTSNSYTYIGLATSEDGRNWVKRSNPVLSPTGNESRLHANSVIKIGNKYFLYYSSWTSNGPRVCLATSLDGISWTKHSNNPIIVPSASWEQTGLYYPTVVFDGNKYRMVYMNNHPSSNSFGEATSEDGINWTKNPNNPFFHASKTHNNWASSVFYPFMVKTPSGINLYYTGIEASSNEEKIGLVRK